MGRARYAAAIVAVATVVTAVVPALLWAFHWPQSGWWIEGHRTTTLLALWSGSISCALVTILADRWRMIGAVAVTLFLMIGISVLASAERAPSIDMIFFVAILLVVPIGMGIMEDAAREVREQNRTRPGQSSRI